MSEYADKHSGSHRKDRVDHILSSTSKGKVDASGYEVPGELDTERKTGPEQPKPRKFAKGGAVEGHKAHHHAGRKSRDMGGPMPSAVDQLRPQVPTGGLYGSGFSPTHAGALANEAGLKKGGAAKKRADGGGVQRKDGTSRAEWRKEKQHSDIAGTCKMETGDAEGNTDVTGVRVTGGRKARAEGGRAKDKAGTKINIIIGGPKEAPPMGPPPPSAMPPGKPPLPPAAMGPMAGPGGGMGGPGMPPGAAPGGPPGMPPQMPPGMMGR